MTLSRSIATYRPFSFLRSGLIAAGALFVSCCPLFAQRDAGLLGKQYAGLTVFTEDVRHVDIGSGYGTGVTANFPVTSHLDVSLAASYERFNDVRLTDKRLNASVVGYQEVSGVKLFVDGSLGSTSQSIKIADQKITNNDGLYAFGIGIEAPIAPATALFGRIAYNRYFDQDNGDYWTYSVGLNHWISEKLGLVIAVTAYDDDSIVYGAGVNLRF